MTCLRAAPALLACLLVQACAGGVDLDRMGQDHSIITGSISSSAAPQDSSAQDEAAIRATVSAWMPGSTPPELMPWVNIQTGSSGAIARVSDANGPEGLCRSFTASREAFDGVGLYRGRACSANGGRWVVLSLDKS